MAGSSLLVLIDDIATLLDDVATMTKIATKKTASVLGDDLAVNAQQVTGVNPERELPVVWAVAKGSFINKCILVPAALAISAFIPVLIIPLLIIGGLYLCYEGFEKVWHYFSHTDDATAEKHHQQLVDAVADESVDMVAFEKEKISGAIRTDFILSAEIIVISLGVVSEQPFLTQVVSLSFIAILITIGVYGLVAGIVKLDDAGLYLSRKEGWQKQLGLGLIAIAPKLMKFLSVFGTLAMFLVGGGIISHYIPLVHHWAVLLGAYLGDWPWSGVLTSIAGIILDLVIGLILGALTLLLVTGYQRLKPEKNT